MVRFLIFSIFIIRLFSTQAYDQEGLQVSSFALLPHDVTAKVLAPERDADGKLAALVKLVTAETGFEFDGGALGIVKFVPQVGEYWLYVLAKATTITIKH